MYFIFSIFVATQDNNKCSNGNIEHTQGMGLFYVIFTHFNIYIPWYQYITFQVTLKILYHWVPLNVMLVFKSFRLNLFNMVLFFTLKDVPGGHPTGSRTIWTILILRLSKSTLTETNILLFQIYMVSQNTIFINLSINILVMYLFQD